MKGWSDEAPTEALMAGEYWEFDDSHVYPSMRLMCGLQLPSDGIASVDSETGSPTKISPVCGLRCGDVGIPVAGGLEPKSLTLRYQPIEAPVVDQAHPSTPIELPVSVIPQTHVPAGAPGPVPHLVGPEAPGPPPG